MKTVVISKDEKELARIPLNQKRLLAGRSPSCEAVVRSKGIKPVQFMIEHVSENLDSASEETYFDVDAGFWTLIDISEHSGQENEKKNSGMGAGIVLDNTVQNFNGFDFQVIQDTLLETHLKKGVLTRSLGDNIGGAIESVNTTVAEVVYFNKDLDIITNILHLNKNKTTKKLRLFAQLPNFLFEWDEGKESKAQLKLENEDFNFEIYRRGERITPEFIQSKRVEINNRDIVHVETKDFEFFLRLVPEVEVVLPKFSWAKDYLITTSFFIFCIAIALIFVVNSVEVPPEEVKEPPRVVKLEIPPPPPEKEARTAQPAPPPKEIETAPLAVDKKDIKNPSEKPQAQNEAAKVSVENRPAEKPKAGLNSQAKPKDVNTLGLLAKLKGSSSAPQKVTADKVLNQGTVSESIAGDGVGRVVVNKAPSGVVGQANKPVNPNALAEASTTLAGASISNSEANNALAASGGTSRFSNGSQLNNLKGSQNGTQGNGGQMGDLASGTGLEKGDSMQAVGGLDKEAIRKALRENRRALANCYETALLTKKQLDGRMTFRWVIAPAGNVTTAKLQSSELGLPTFESCIESVIKAIRFPQAPNKSSTTVIYPFVFQGKK